MTFFEKVKELCWRKGVSIHKCEMDLGFANGYLRSLKRLPPYDKVVDMARYFGVSEADLTADDKIPVPISKTAKIPLFGSVAAGLPILATEDIIDWIEISEEMANRGEYFAVVVKGDSMSPKLLEGDVVIVRKQPDAESGQTVVVKVNGEEAVIKKLIKYANGIALQSVNPVYHLLQFSSKEIEESPVTILGVVEEMRRRI